MAKKKTTEQRLREMGLWERYLKIRARKKKKKKKKKPKSEPEPKPKPKPKPKPRSKPQTKSGNRSEYYKHLNDQNRAIVDYYQRILESQNENRQRRFNQALTLAEAQAEPYWKEVIRTVKDAAQRAFGIYEADLAEQELDLSRRKREIEQDLIYNKEQLTIEEQSELARRKKEYDSALEGIRETMASRGLISSTIRTKAEERTAEAHKDILESTERRYARELRAQEIGAERGMANIVERLKAFRRRTEEAKTTKAREVERYLGTETLGELPSLKPYALGNIYGSIKAEKKADILRRAEGLMVSGL